MNIAFVACGLPGPAYHGGAVTCWAILRAMAGEGHQVNLISLFDTSPANPYLSSRDVQGEAIRALGIPIHFVEYRHDTLAPSAQTFGQRLATYCPPTMAKLFPWSKLASSVESILRDIKPDAIFVYHFDALSAVYQTRQAPIIAGVGDLWHLPSFFLWQAQPHSLRKYTVGLALQVIHYFASNTLMRKMLLPCAVRGAFAAHYAAELRTQKGLLDTRYFHTPAHDPVGATWLEARQTAQAERRAAGNRRPKILMIGDITGTAARWGLRLLVDDVIPALERALGPDGFEIHLVGGGSLNRDFSVLETLPFVKIRGRVVPPDPEFLDADLLFVPTPITLGIRVRIITGFSFGSCLVTHIANAAGIPELSDGTNALIADSGPGLASAMLRALQDPDLRLRLSRGARSTFETIFSEATAAREIVRAVESVTRS